MENEFDAKRCRGNDENCFLGNINSFTIIFYIMEVRITRQISMVKKKIFLRMAKTVRGINRIVVDVNYNPAPVWSNTDPCTRQYLPTAHFAVEVDIPDKKFVIESETIKKMNFKLKNDRLVEAL